jgi:hypothetical protein
MLVARLKGDCAEKEVAVGPGVGFVLGEEARLEAKTDGPGSE